MTVSFWPFPKGSSGSQVLEDKWSQMARNWLATGVIKGFLNQLAVTAAGTAMQVNIDTGAANIMGDWFKSDTSVAMQIAAADATNPRIDVIAIRVDWVANTVAFVVLQGTPAANPVAPALTQTDILTTPATARWEIALANVTVPAAATVIQAANVTDKRTYTAGPTSTPTPGATAQYDQSNNLNANSFQGKWNGLSADTSATPSTVAERDSSGGLALTGYSASAQSGFRAYATSAQSYSTTNTNIKLLFAAIDYDNQSEFSTTNSRFTAKSAGIYCFSASVTMNSVTDGMGYLLSIFKNGAQHSFINQGLSGAAGNISGSGMAILKLNAGDYVELYLSVTSTCSGGGNNITQFFAGSKIA